MVSVASQINRRIKAGRFALAGVLWISPVVWAASYSPCDLNQDGVVNGADVTLAVNMALERRIARRLLKGLQLRVPLLPYNASSMLPRD